MLLNLAYVYPPKHHNDNILLACVKSMEYENHDILSVAVDSPCETPHLHLQLCMHSYNLDTAD